MLDHRGKVGVGSTEVHEIIEQGKEGHMWAIFMAWEEQAMQIKMMFNQKPKEEVAKTDQVPQRMEECH